MIESVVKRIIEMDPLSGEVVLTGGVVAHNPVLAEMLAQLLGHSVHILPHAQLAGAFGAALLARSSDYRITSYNVCYTKLLRSPPWRR